MTWDEIEDELESRGLRYYHSAYGPIPIDTWSKPDGGTAGRSKFVNHNSIDGFPLTKSSRADGLFPSCAELSEANLPDRGASKANSYQ